MANPQHLEILKRSVREWNQLRAAHPDVRPDLSGADLSEANLSGANLSGADLGGAGLEGALLDRKHQVLYLRLFDAKKLTPYLLSTSLSPYLNAVEQIQFVIDEAQGNSHNEVVIKFISQNSSISVSLEGATKAVQEIIGLVVSWRRKHQKTLSQLKEQEIRAEIGIKNSEFLEKQAKAAKDHAEAERVNAEAAKQRAEAEKILLENEKLRLDLQRSKIELSLELLAQIAPHLSDTDKIAYVIKLLPPLDVVVTSDLEIRNNK